MRGHGEVGRGQAPSVARPLARRRYFRRSQTVVTPELDGVGSSGGLALLARVWATEAIRSGKLPRGSALARLDPDALSESAVARAAAAGDEAASAIIERLAQRLARICIVLGDVLDVDLISVGGDAATTLPAVIERAGEIVARSDDPTAPLLVASDLGADAVIAGAVQHALAQVRERALQLSPGARHAA